MNKTDEAILENAGWEVECESPFEIRNSETESFATNEAAYAILESLRPKEDVDPKRVLWNLEPDEFDYMAKLAILYSLITQPSVSHLIPAHISKWCLAQGFVAELRCEDRTSWWVCGLKEDLSVDL